MVHIDLSDDGPGLSAVAREHLFEPFAGSSRRGGTGLGLAIAYDIVMAHGGKIKLAQTGDAGTTFQVCLSAIHLKEVD